MNIWKCQKFHQVGTVIIGLVSFFQADNGWCYHANFGWIFPESQNDGSLWIWSDQLKWLWLSASSFSESYAFSSEENDWIYFDFTFGNEMYFSVKSDSWLLFDKNKKTSILDSLFLKIKNS